MPPTANTGNSKNSMQRPPKHILLSRTDGIGDVVLTLPMAGVLKKHFPNTRISFLGRTYTKAIVESSKHVDGFFNWDEATEENEAEFIAAIGADTVIHVFPRKEVVLAAYTAGCKVRVGTARRIHTFLRVNRRLWYSRKKSPLHEAALNIKMLEALGIRENLDDQNIAGFYGMESQVPLPEAFRSFIEHPHTVLLHPLSHGSAPVWPEEAYLSLAEQLLEDGFQVGITGTADEGQKVPKLTQDPRITNFCGKLSLAELMTLISQSTGLVAASTGPLHIAAALARHALGLYVPQRPMDAGRWRPIGEKAEYLSAKDPCLDGVLTIPVDQVVGRVRAWKAKR